MGLIALLAGTATAGCGVLVVLTLIDLVRDRQPGRVFLVVAGLVTVVLAVLTVAVTVRLVEADSDVNPITFVGYHVVATAALPAAVLWAAGERTRAGVAVLLIAALVVPILLLRAAQVWSGG